MVRRSRSVSAAQVEDQRHVVAVPKPFLRAPQFDAPECVDAAFLQEGVVNMVRFCKVPIEVERTMSLLAKIFPEPSMIGAS